MPRYARPWTAIAALLLAASTGCRTGAGPGRAPSAPQPDLLRSYVGQARIVRQYGDQKNRSLDRKEAGQQSGGCDAAVEVRDVAFEKGVVQLRLEYLGQPRVESKRSDCRRRPVPEIAFRITGFRADEPAEAVASVVGRVLLTPEAFLAAHGIGFDLPPAPSQPLVADRSAVGQPAEIRLGREVTRWPQRLLAVEPAYADPRRKIRHEGQIEFDAMVGSDGRLYGPHVLTPLSDTHEKQILRAFSLWRFDPARKGDQPVGARVSERTVFRIY